MCVNILFAFADLSRLSVAWSSGCVKTLYFDSHTILPPSHSCNGSSKQTRSKLLTGKFVSKITNWYVCCSVHPLKALFDGRKMRDQKSLSHLHFQKSVKLTFLFVLQTTWLCPCGGKFFRGTRAIAHWSKWGAPICPTQRLLKFRHFKAPKNSDTVLG